MAGRLGDPVNASDTRRRPCKGSFPAVCIVEASRSFPLSFSACLSVSRNVSLCFSSWSRFSHEGVSLVFVTGAGQVQAAAAAAGVEAAVTGPLFAESEVKLVGAHHYDNVFLVGKGAKHGLAGFSREDLGSPFAYLSLEGARTRI